MIGEMYVLNQNLEPIGIIENYKSCIWANRYKEVGDCEIYIEATNDNLKLFQKNNYIIRDDDDMVCRIKKIELDTNNENGNYLIITGYDVKDFADQRIIWETMNCDGLVEDFIRDMIDKSLCSNTYINRKLVMPNGNQLLFLGARSGLIEKTQEQISYKNIGEKIREYCTNFGWGYKVIYVNNHLEFILYKGTNRSEYVVFSNNYENLQSTKYTDDNTNLGNVALIGGEGDGSERSKEITGNEKGVNRYEIFVDAKDISKNIKYSDLINLYPNGTIVNYNNIYGYKMNLFDIQIIDEMQLLNLKTKYPDGTEIMVDNYMYYRIPDVIIAEMETNNPNENTDVILQPLIYSVYLLNRGCEKLSEYGNRTSFEGTIEPTSTFKYKEDYFLGDLVTVENDFGISIKARICEIIEVNDDNGYSVEPKFEYLEEV